MDRILDPGQGRFVLANLAASARRKDREVLIFYQYQLIFYVGLTIASIDRLGFVLAAAWRRPIARRRLRRNDSARSLAEFPALELGGGDTRSRRPLRGVKFRVGCPQPRPPEAKRFAALARAAGTTDSNIWPAFAMQAAPDRLTLLM
jgi:hypothetical protein